LKPRVEDYPNDDETVTQCPDCRGTGWVRHKVPLEHPDFGNVFRCHCVSESPEAIKHTAEMMIRYNNFPKGKPRTFDDIGETDTTKGFDRIPGTEDALALAQAWAMRTDTAPFLMLNGTNGCGKSHLLQAAGRCMVANGYMVKYESAEMLLRKLRATIANPDGPSMYDVEAAYINAEVLLLDELGSVNATSFSVSTLATIINERYQDEKLTALATHLSRDKTALVLGSTIASRLWDTDTGITALAYITAGDHRTGVDHWDYANR